MLVETSFKEDGGGKYVSYDGLTDGVWKIIGPGLSDIRVLVLGDMKYFVDNTVFEPLSFNTWKNWMFIRCDEPVTVTFRP